jgi:hypothetical protein
MSTKGICQLAWGVALAACMTGCGGLASRNPGSQDAGARTDAIDAPKPSVDSPPPDARWPSEPLADQADSLAADGGGDTMAGRDVPGGLDGQVSMDGGIDGFVPPLDVSGQDLDAPAADAGADIGPGVSPLDGRNPSEAGIDQGPACAEGSTASCASPSNPLIGACRAGTRVCSGGAWGPCSEVLPAASEECNGIDDDCNGMIDEGCAAGCIVVCAKCAGSTDDAATADGSVDHPFASVEAALAAVDPVDGGTRRRICVVGGATCRESTLYPSTGPLKMPDGLIIQGAYAVTENGLEYCGIAALKPRTTLAFAASEGVVFDETIAAGAELSSLVIEITPPAGAASPAATGTAIAVKGGKNVMLSRVFVSESFAATTTYGVAITAGGQATITGSSISTGQGRASAVGVYVSGGTVNLRNNCDRIVEGRCESYCGGGDSSLGIRGFMPGTMADAPLQSSGVFIAGNASSLVGNMICGGASQMADGQSVAVVAALRCEGAGCATASGNVIAGGTDRDAVAVALVGADPLLDGNRIEGGCGSRTSTGVWLEGSSARLQNNRVFGGQCPGAEAAVFRGLHLIASAGGNGPDVHSNDIDPLGLAADCQSIGVLVEPAAGADNATAGVLRNNIISAGVCNRRFAISEAAGATLKSVQNNDLYGPTGAPSAASLVLYRHGNQDATTAAQVNAIALASGNISADPRYVSYPNDLHLTAQSPCIDQGTSDGAPASDAVGNVRPAGVGYDIGAYELTW